MRPAFPDIIQMRSPYIEVLVNQIEMLSNWNKHEQEGVSKVWGKFCIPRT